MKIIKGIRTLKKPIGPSVLTIGVFDGIHIGHRKIIGNVVRKAAARALKSVVVTFDPHPLKVVKPGAAIPSLLSIGHRARLIEELGVDVLVILKFTKAMARISPEEFVRDILVGKLGAGEICVGNNFYFGRGGRAGIKQLEALGRAYGFRVNVMGSVRARGAAVSSSRIRRLITTGRLREAAKMLGRRVSVLGTVVGGARLARELGYPTANLNPHHEVIPPGGVYAVFVRYEGRIYKGVLNIGLRPTFYAPRDREPAIEVHVFGFKKKIYGRDLEALFVKKLREEKAFPDKSALVAQIRADEKEARLTLRY
ncbi:MAG: bifunctional riboflavin kinase/FAD synthetase [Candidatus Omnitrophica bacterium]|nr:bifunctional riboflavin kinase/FAD synthetase [Candidatus Omnitrophota bacterium]